MSSTAANVSRTVLKLQEHGELLDVIDRVRSQGVGHFVQLPQIIVCGDQSSGKSSVLEAISRITFPAKDTVCTRFATELILRRDSVVSIDVKINAGANRTDDERKRVQNFRCPSTIDLQNFGSVVESAKDHLTQITGSTGFSEDVLRVELSGPDQPHLTLVDLPGLIHAGTDEKSTDDVLLVSSIVKKYMGNARSIILAVVSAKNDYANQVVTTYARDADPKGIRTIGIITKPDDLKQGSDSENAFIELARNKSATLRLGWHVLRNRDYETQHYTTEQRDNQEAAFFAQAPWKNLSPRVLGIEALKRRLSSILKDHILSEMPSLINDIETEIAEAKATINRLGQARGSPAERRLYLIQLSQGITSLVCAATDGVYTAEFFRSGGYAVGASKRLRAVVQNILIRFSEEMRDFGHAVEIVENPSELAFATSTSPKQVTRDEFLDVIKEHMRKSRGKELPGTFNPLIIGELFYAQAEPWVRILKRYSRSLLEATRITIDAVVRHVADETTAERLTHDIIDPAMEELSKRVDEKMAEILKLHRGGHPITYNHYFVDTVQEARKDHERKQQASRLYEYFDNKRNSPEALAQLTTEDVVRKLLRALESNEKGDMERYACSEALFCMQAYYEVARKLVVDNFAQLVIENCLLERLQDIFSPKVAMSIDKTKAEAIATEPDHAREERRQAEIKLESLAAGLAELSRLHRPKVVRVWDANLEDDNVPVAVNDDGESADGEEPNAKAVNGADPKVETPGPPQLVAVEPPSPDEPVQEVPSPELSPEPEAKYVDPFFEFQGSRDDVKKGAVDNWVNSFGSKKKKKSRKAAPYAEWPISEASP